MDNKDTTMLPPFRVRRILPLGATAATLNKSPSAVSIALLPATTASTAAAHESSSSIKYIDGVILMNKDEYENLVKQQPQAALRYVDEDDGETIHVGSALELDQRLKEPVGGAKLSSKHSHGRPRPFPSILDIHSFDVERQQDVIKTWADIHAHNKNAGLIAKSTHRLPSLSFGETSPLTHNAPKTPAGNPADIVHAKRWAGYGSMPTTFDAKPWTAIDHDSHSSSRTALLGRNARTPLPQSEMSFEESPVNMNTSKPMDLLASAPPTGSSSSTELSPEELRWESYKSQKANDSSHTNANTVLAPSSTDPFESQKAELERDISRVRESLEQGSSSQRGGVQPELAKVAEKNNSTFDQPDDLPEPVHQISTPVLSSTLQVPTKPKQEKEYMPLLELFQAQLAQLRPDGVTRPQAPVIKDTTASHRTAPIPKAESLASEVQLSAIATNAGANTVNINAPLEGIVTDLLTSVASSVETSCRSLFADLRAPLMRTQQTVLNDVEKLVDGCVRMMEPPARTTNPPGFNTESRDRTESKLSSNSTTAATKKDDITCAFVPNLKQCEYEEADTQAFEHYCKVLEKNNVRKQQSDLRALKEFQSRRKPKSATPFGVAVQKALTDHWQPEDVMASRSISYCVGGQDFHQYLIRWKDHDSEDDCWVDEQALQNYQQIIRSFNVRNATERAHRRGWGLHTNTSHLPTLSTFKDNVILEPRPQIVRTSSDPSPQDGPVELTVLTPAIPIATKLPVPNRPSGLTCPICGELFFDPEKPGIMLKCKCAETSWSVGTNSKPGKSTVSKERSSTVAMDLPDVPKAEPSTRLGKNDDKGFNFDSHMVCAIQAPEVDRKKEPTLWELSAEPKPRQHERGVVRGDDLPVLSESSRTLFEALISGDVGLQTQTGASGISQPLITFDSISDGFRVKNASTSASTTTIEPWTFAPVTKENLQNLKSHDDLSAIHSQSNAFIGPKIAGDSIKPLSHAEEIRKDDFRDAASAFLQWNKEHPVTVNQPADSSRNTTAATTQGLAAPIRRNPTIAGTKSSPWLSDYQTNLTPPPAGESELHRSQSLNAQYQPRNGAASFDRRTLYGTSPNAVASRVAPQCLVDEMIVSRAPPGGHLAPKPWASQKPVAPTKPIALTSLGKPLVTTQTGTPIQQRLNSIAAAMSAEISSLNTRTDTTPQQPSRPHNTQLNSSPLNPTNPPLSPAPSELPESSTSAQRRRCIAQLLEMGYQLDKALLVAEQAEGDMEKALDMLEEDAKIWNGRERGKARAGHGGARGPVPGSWDDQLYG